MTDKLLLTIIAIMDLVMILAVLLVVKISHPDCKK